LHETEKNTRLEILSKIIYLSLCFDGKSYSSLEIYGICKVYLQNSKVMCIAFSDVY